MAQLRPYDESCMKAAIAQSQAAVDNGCMPFGAVCCDVNGNILVEAQNGSAAAKKRGGSGDVTRHAEMELVRMLSTTVDAEQRSSATIYTSTEPCVMCAGACYWSGVSRIVYGCSSETLENLSGPGGFDIAIEKLYKMGRPGTRTMEVVGPLLSDEAMQVHQNSGVWSKHGVKRKTTDKDIETGK